MNYWEARKLIKNIIPRQKRLLSIQREIGMVKEKGRKGNYKQFNLLTKEYEKHERLLKVDEVNNFLEVSCRAAACPMPLNMDLWDGLHCPHCCLYCFADTFRASLYSAFFDNYKTLKLRHCNSSFYKRELDKLFPLRGNIDKAKGEVAKAIAMEIPIRLGIRFDDFHDQERLQKISLGMLQYLKDNEYPVMINTKSYVIGLPDYVKALADNKAGSAVHVTLISSDEELLKKIEPGAPSFSRRLKAMKNLTEAGVRVVARIEPFMVFINDEKEKVEQYIESIWEAGVRNITFDTYSYSANNPGIRNNFYNIGYDFERMWLATTDSQPIGSFLLGKFMDLFKEKGFSCSTFDSGNVDTNSQSICCEVGDLFKEYNYGSMIMAIRFIKDKSKLNKSVKWSDFSELVDINGGFLSEKLRLEMKHLWNCEGNESFSVGWGNHLIPVGRDEDGIIWKYKSDSEDYRERMLENLL